MPENLIGDKKVAIYTGCFNNYYYPEAGQAAVKVLRKNRVQVIVPDQVCCGLPMIAKGNTKGAYKNLEYNVNMLGQAVADGYAVITTCSSCGLMIKRNYPLLLHSEQSSLVAENHYHITEYLMKLNEIGQLDTNLQSISQTVFYHTPCHLTAQQTGDVSVEMLKLVPGITINQIGRECCGMAGAYGYEKANYTLSREIAGKLYSEIEENPADRIVTDCGGCKLQIESGTGQKAVHPIILLKESYGV
ncbi:MAG: hypothetical protein JSV77_11035 [Dehalococcoidales bacterium]|nr:MAG: hypothetical protein JSV77_11035 [Dehalococcoidales bacterium]